MLLITPETRIADTVIAHPEIITVLNRFGIDLGLGDNTLAGLCRVTDVNPEFLATILNTFLNRDYFPESRLRSFDISLIVRYLMMANNSYAHFHLPTIERHFGMMLAKDNGANNNLALMFGFFKELQAEIAGRIEDDSRLLAETKPLSHSQVQAMHNADALIEDKLLDLLTMMVKHLSGDYDRRLCQAVIMGIVGLRHDVVNNNRLRVRLLYPSIQAQSKI